MTHYSIEPRTRNYVKGYGFLSFARVYPINTGEKYEILLQKQVRITQKPLKILKQNIVKPKLI